jgi:uncharacterized protein YacL
MEIRWFILGVRVLFLALCVYFGWAVAPVFGLSKVFGGVCGGLFGGAVVGLDLLLTHVSVRHFSHAVVGLLVGLFAAFLITKLGVLHFGFLEVLENSADIRNTVEVLVFAAFGFLGITMALRADRDQFALIIPYVRFKRDASEGEPLLLDTNVVIDGRVPKIYSTGFLSGRIVVPRIVLDELQRLADARDPIKSERGKRGLRELQEMRGIRSLDVTIHQDSGMESDTVDSRLVTLARSLNARLLTNDDNLAQVARLRGIPVLMLTELVRAMQSELLTGDVVELQLVRTGKEKHQAVGYLPDGAMVVINHAAPMIGQVVKVQVSGTTQTSAGRLVFAEIQG